MTNPILALASTEEIGRLYQLPTGTREGKVSSQQAWDAVQAGELFPSITNCCGVVNPNLEGYVAFMYGKALAAGQETREAEKAHITYRDLTADRGTRVHLAIEDFINAGFAKPGKFEAMIESEYYKALPSYRELQKYTNTYNLLGKSNDVIYFEGFLKFVREVKPRFISQEATVYGETFSGRKYAGTTDFIAEIGGEMIVGDWKTTSKIKQSVSMQLAAVANAKQITTDFKTLEPMPELSGSVAVQLKKDGTYAMYRGKNLKQAWVNFQAARTIWDMVAFNGRTELLVEV